MAIGTARCGPNRLLGLGLLALLLSLAAPAGAHASTARAHGLGAFHGGHDQRFFYDAAPGEANDVTISMHQNGTYQDEYKIKDTGATITPGENCRATSDPHEVICDVLGQLSSGLTVTVHLGDRHDKLRLTPTIETYIYGESGDDTLSVSGWIDDVHGGDGNDTLITTDEYADNLFGEAGDDTFKTSQPLSRTDADGGPGSDTFDFSNRSGDIVATANSAETETVNGYPNIENFIGGSGDDTLTGDGGPNSLAGGRGDDTLSGLGGDDTLEPGPGFIQEGLLVFTDDDTVDGGEGTGDLVTYKARTADLVIDADGVADDGGSSEDDNVQASVEHIHGGSGDDQLTGNSANNVINGWTGTDVLDGEGGTGDVASYEGRSTDLVLTIDGNANDGNAAVSENDTIRTDIENVWGGRGDDDITGNSFSGTFGRVISGVNELRGGFGDDDIDGEGANDTLLGNGSTELVLASDDDTLDGGPGDDRLEGDTWNAVFFDPEPDNLIGGDGTDLADYSLRDDDLTIDIPEPPPNFLATPPPNNDGRAGENDRVYSSIENVTGGAGGDTITGSSAANVLAGGGGRDAISGGAGADTLNGGDEEGSGAPGDTLDGGEGSDTLNGGADNDVLVGGAAADTLNGDGDRDTLTGDAGGDTLNGGAAADTLNGGPDGDILTAGGGHGDTLNGDAGADDLSIGLSVASTLNGGEDADVISSAGTTSGGTSTLNGGGGDDTFTTGTARDDVIGGTGVDHVSYGGRSTAVTVTTGTNAFDDGQAAPAGDDRVHADVENVTGGPMGDSLTGDGGANRLDGGAGPDTLVGGEGADALVGGSEDDHLKSRDAAVDSDDCGSGAADRVTRDHADTVTGCEQAAPLNDPTAPPAISGTAIDGGSLMVDPGTWSGSPSFAYEWRRCDAAGANCANISGAAGSTYSPTPDDVGKTLRAAVIATNAVDTVGEESAPSPVVMPAPPASVAPPAISGEAIDGGSLSATTGTWSGTPPLTFTHQWRRCDATGADCADISGATGASYAPGHSDVGRRLIARVTATNVTGAAQAASADSPPSEPIEPAPPRATAAPTISGTARAGESQSASPGSWSGTPPISFAFQWRRCSADEPRTCTDISGATSDAYTATADDVAHRLLVRVTASNAGGTASAESAESRVFLPASASPNNPSASPNNPAPPDNVFSVNRVTLSRKKGTATLALTVPGPGTLALLATSKVRTSTRAAAIKTITVARLTRRPTAAGRLKLRIRPSRRAKRVLAQKGRLRTSVRLTYTPTGGTRSVQTRRLTLRLQRRR